MIEACPGRLHKKVVKKYFYFVLPNFTKIYLHIERHERGRNSHPLRVESVLKAAAQNGPPVHPQEQNQPGSVTARAKPGGKPG